MPPLQKIALFATVQGAVLGFSSYIAGGTVSLKVVAALSVTTALVQQAARATFKEKLKNKDKLACFLTGSTVSVVIVRCFTGRSLASLAYLHLLPLIFCRSSFAAHLLCRGFN